MLLAQRSREDSSRGAPVLPSALEWLYLIAGLFLVFRYRWLFDDSFIYYRYVDNLLFLDAGLTYNAGEFVEGYTSPLHCLILLVLRAARLSYPAISLGMGLVLFTLFCFLLVRLNRALTGGAARSLALNFPLAFLATNYSATSFFTSGNEAALLHVVAAANALLLVRPGSRWLAALVATSPLVRPELSLSLALTIAFISWRNRRLPTLLVSLSGLFNGCWLLFRVYYYADFLPNTFYLKHGSNLQAGLRYLVDTTGPYHIGAILVSFLCLGAFLATRQGREENGQLVRLELAPRVAMLVIAAAITAYVVHSGGSSMHYYYLAAPLTLMLCAFGGLLEAGVAEIRRSAPSPHIARLASVLMFCLTLLLVSWYPPNLTRHPVTGEARMRKPPSQMVITDPAFWRNRGSWRREALGGWPTIADMREFAPELRTRGYREWIRSGSCSTMYTRFRKRSVHKYGLTDGILARVDVPESMRGHKPRLQRLADDIVELQRSASAIDRGMYRAAVEEGRAPRWVVDNLELIELIERKVYNRHDLLENLQLALQSSPKIMLSTRRRDSSAPR